MKRRQAFVALCALAASLMIAPAGRAAASCAGAHHGGEWRMYGHDLSGTRTQTAETTIDTGNAGNLSAHWKASTDGVGATGIFANTPVIADGCVWLGSNTGWVIALNADTGELVWKTLLPVTQPGPLGGGIVGSVSVDSGKVVVLVNQLGSPYAAALDEANGDVLWKTTIDTMPYSFSNAGSVVWDGLVFAGFNGSEYHNSESRGGFAIIDEASGVRLRHTYTITDADWDLGYRGASIWATAVVDSATGYAFVGTGNPGGHAEGSQATIEDPRANSIIKIDMNRDSQAFGSIVDSYKGNSDQYIDGLDKQPACDMFGETLTYGIGGDTQNAWSVPCAQLDLDFGASPNLFRDAKGRAVVGELQKSGVYHVAYRDNMARAWSAIVGSPCTAVCNAGTTATDGSNVYGVGAPPGEAFSLNGAGGYRWVGPVADGAHYESTATANGVVYTIDNAGALLGFDAATGAPLLHRPTVVDAGANTADLNSNGPAIARDMVFAPVENFIIAYGVD